MPQYDPVVIVLWFFWFTVLGACVGSFLNVLVYRLPLRKSLVHPPSHCPRCGHLIRWYDNVPVIGWIKLRGKCRDCRLPISVRYPCIEGFCGILFGSAFVLLEQLLDCPFWLLIILTLFLSFLGMTFLAVCLIIYDSRKGNVDP